MKFPQTEIVLVDTSKMPCIQNAPSKFVKLYHRPELKSRAQAMNEGVKVSHAFQFIFVHADCELPSNSVSKVEDAIRDGAVGGAFLKAYEPPRVILQLQSHLLNWIAKNTQRCITGTNALFMRRDTFEEWGGYKDIPLFEDVNLTDKLRRSGRMKVIENFVTVSSRKYRFLFGLPRGLRNTFLYALYRVGFSPAFLARLY